VQFYLARSKDELGKTAEALDDFLALLPMTERVKGIEAGDTLATRAYIALCKLDLGRYAEAEADFTALLPIEERVKGGEHPAILVTHIHLARSELENGKTQAALMRLEAFGAKARDILGSKNSILAKYLIVEAMCLDALNCREEATPKLTEAKAILERHTLPEHYWRRKLDAYLEKRETNVRSLDVPKDKKRKPTGIRKRAGES
jgi:tetratricopeptide (TPR) repeat protein